MTSSWEDAYCTSLGRCDSSFGILERLFELTFRYLAELLQQVTGDYYYISSSLYSSKVISDVKISNMIGRIGESSSLQSADQQPVIVLVAHLDCTGVAPGLSYGANSDASGIVAVLEIVRMLGKVVRTQKSSPKTDIIILLSSGGKFNFFGTKKWLEEQTDTTEGSLTGRIQYAVCFDGIGGQFPPNVYVSRPPKEGSPTAKILQVSLKLLNECEAVPGCAL